MQIQNEINMNVKGKTKLYGLIGNPIGHTISPQIHNTLAKALDIDMVYVPAEVREDKLEDAIKGLKSLGFQGFNVTIPYKEEIIKFMDELDESAKRYEAVNTVLIKDNRLIGYNTDADGFYRSFVETFKCEIKDQNVLFVGAGGATNSVASVFAEKDAGSITIANRTLDNARKVCKRVSGLYLNPITPIELKDDLDIEPYDVIINTTSAGMYPNTDITVLRDSKFSSRQKVVDIIYNPAETSLLKRARQSGASTLNGFGMLYYQGVLAFEIWNSMRIPKDIEKNVYELFCDNLSSII